MKRAMRIAVLVAWAAVAAWGQQGAKTAPKSEAKAGSGVVEDIKKIENERDQAMVRGDVGTLERLTSDDYTMVGATGHMSSKERMLADVKSGELKYSSIMLDDLNVRVYGTTAVVTGRRTVHGKHGAADFSGADRFLRVYVKQGGQWRAVAFQATRIPNQ